MGEAGSISTREVSRGDAAIGTPSAIRVRFSSEELQFTRRAPIDPTARTAWRPRCLLSRHRHSGKATVPEEWVT